MKKNVFKLLCLCFFIIAFVACEKNVDPMTSGDYYVTNNTTNTVILAAEGNWGSGAVALLADEVLVGSKTHVYTFTEGSGGHVLPSNAWGDFYVYDSIVSDSNIIYSGIHNADWIYEGTNSEGHLIYSLSIY